MKCKLCGSTVWFWQRSFDGHHIDCYLIHMLDEKLDSVVGGLIDVEEEVKKVGTIA